MALFYGSFLWLFFYGSFIPFCPKGGAFMAVQPSFARERKAFCFSPPPSLRRLSSFSYSLF